MPDLWPDNFGTPSITSPISILREQAVGLKRKTQGLVEGRVLTTKAEDQFVHHFYAVVPSLDGYSYKLFSVRHPIRLYPLVIDADVLEREYEAANEEAFLGALKTILGSEEVKQVMQALLAQAESPAVG